MTDHFNHDFKPVRFHVVLAFGVAAFFTFALLGVAFGAEPVPPLIGQVKRLVRDLRTTLDRKAPGVPRDAAPADAGWCHAPLVPDALDDIPERAEVERAIAACDRLRGGVWRVVDPFLVVDLFRLEESLGAPRALLVGAYCVEASMRPSGRYAGRFLGDWRDGAARASGPLQLHENVWRGTCRGSPDAPHSLAWAARCYWQEVLRVEAKARRVTRCAEADMLGVGEANAANVRRYGWRCDARSTHWQTMEAMRSPGRGP